MDEKMTIIEDWAPLNPSPRTFMANFLNEEFNSKSFPDLSAENRSEKPLSQSESQKVSMISKEESNENEFNFCTNMSIESSLFDGRKSSSKGGLAQRIARSGFNAPTINTARIKSANMSSSPSEVRSPYLTIPPGLSPTTLLDSPVFLSNSMAQPSPTTGKLSFSGNESADPDKSKDNLPEDVAFGGFAFKPPRNASSSSYFSSMETKSSDLSFQKHFNIPASVSESSDTKACADDNSICLRPTDSFVGNENSSPLEDQPEGEADTKAEFSSSAVAAPAEDGYNWRKYGQKHVKGSEYPRSYYKCTHPSCPVKKKVERSHEGHITEIIYKGAHNHEKPLPNRRSGVPSSHPFSDSQMEANFDGKMPVWAENTTTSSSIAAEFGDQTQDGSRFGSPEAVEVSSTVSNGEEEEEQVTHGSVSIGGDVEGDETESKRRKLDACAVEMSTASRAVREPRVVVQTTSEVDILDDGYRWRKYGQKVVKGNPNPRSYYKCTNPGCTVRKHVERASHDLKSVITTYEGKHNHDVPAARNSGSHSSSVPSTTSASTSANQPHTLHRRQDPTQNSLMRFNGPSPLRTFNLPVGDQPIGLGPGFSFGMGQPGLAGLGLGGLGVFGSIQSYMGQQGGGSVGQGFVIPKGEVEEESVAESGLNVSNGMAAYSQMVGGLPLGPQM